MLFVASRLLRLERLDAGLLGIQAYLRLLLILTHLRHNTRNSKSVSSSSQVNTYAYIMASTPQQRRPNTFHSFLHLPRELRDDIYRSIFSTPPPPPLSPNTSSISPSLGLSILRVNKQIHHEASEILYATVVFPIRISRNDARAINGNTLYYVSQETPWEQLCYRYSGKDGNLLSLNTTDTLGSPKQEYTHPNDAVPSIAYGGRFRKFRIEVADQRTLQTGINTESGSASTKLLFLAVDRLSTLLAPATRQIPLTLEIHAVSRILDQVEEESRRISSRSTILEPLAGFYREKAYKEIIDTIWPLTKGPWRYTIHAPGLLKKEFPGLLEQRLELHNQLEGGETREEGVWREPTTVWDLWVGWGRELSYAGGGEHEIDSMDEEDLDS
ncbi:uncharacterized protein DFL_003431 [Arthrobotrys flagrans]|uniref:F-box domain-containing protein n=1 Tax=Arthrobotrys flagrans TaxID=97331 RepID=A0A437A1Z1_ARTFL|nr:hypothetical protein DFL_003431 [Arthrobotrys flagrans]